VPTILRFAQDFACGLHPFDDSGSRLQNGSTAGAIQLLRGFQILASDDPSLCSGFRLRAPAALTPAKRLNLTPFSKSV
jgi:hypothetical protein